MTDNLDRALSFIESAVPQEGDDANVAIALALLDIAISLRRQADRGLWRPPDER